MKELVGMLALAGLLVVVISNIWLLLIVARGSPLAALLCLFVPFLILFFVYEHWQEAKPAVMAWVAGCAVIILSVVLIQAMPVT